MAIKGNLERIKSDVKLRSQSLKTGLIGPVVLLRKKEKSRGEGEHYYLPTSAPRMCQRFNNFLQASWPSALLELAPSRFMARPNTWAEKNTFFR